MSYSIKGMCEVFSLLRNCDSEGDRTLEDLWMVFHLKRGSGRRRAKHIFPYKTYMRFSAHRKPAERLLFTSASRSPVEGFFPYRTCGSLLKTCGMSFAFRRFMEGFLSLEDV